MVDVLSIVGARPQFIKAVVVSRAFRELGTVQERLLHTGQHYDEKMSGRFFQELGIPQPDVNLAIGSGPHGEQTARMLMGIEAELMQRPADAVLVYGDTNSTLAGALAATKMHIPVVHVEAGLRSFNRRMPEEINRVLTDQVSELLLCPTQEGVRNLEREGITQNVHLVGDVMLDCARQFAPVAQDVADPLTPLELEPRQYLLLTCHRAENTDDRSRLAAIMDAVSTIAASQPVVFPVHPRTRKVLDEIDFSAPPGLRMIDPVSYFEMLVLASSASVVVTDSGGLQKEAFFLGTPCVTIRDETEWTESVTLGANILAGADRERILDAVTQQQNRTEPVPDAGPYYGNGEASAKIVSLTAELR